MEFMDDVLNALAAADEGGGSFRSNSHSSQLLARTPLGAVGSDDESDYDDAAARMSRRESEHAFLRRLASDNDTDEHHEREEEPGDDSEYEDEEAAAAAAAAAAAVQAVGTATAAAAVAGAADRDTHSAEAEAMTFQRQPPLAPRAPPPGYDAPSASPPPPSPSPPAPYRAGAGGRQQRVSGRVSGAGTGPALGAGWTVNNRRSRNEVATQRDTAAPAATPPASASRGTAAASAARAVSASATPPSPNARAASPNATAAAAAVAKGAALGCGSDTEDEAASEAAAGEFGWPDGLFVAPVDELLRCPICACVLRDAVQCGSQHCFCQPCLLRALEEKLACPLCRDPLMPSGVQPNRMVRAMVERLVVACGNRRRGCETTLPLGDWNTHAKVCAYRRVPCGHKGCNAVVSLLTLAEHQATCSFARIVCGECGEQFPKHRSEQHSCVAHLRHLVVQMQSLLHMQDSELLRLRQANVSLEGRVQGLESNLGVMAVGGSRLEGGMRVMGGRPLVTPLRPSLNDIVVLSERHSAYGDAADGPLIVGVAGWVIADDRSDDLPIRVHVHLRGEWWYAVGALRVVARAGERVTRETAIKGVPVIRGPDWKWDNQDGGAGSIGFITRSKGDWCDCTWTHGELDNAYRVGPRRHDLVVARMDMISL